jgi:hypothetical protein
MSSIAAFPRQLDFLRWIEGSWKRKIGIGIGILYVLVGLYGKAAIALLGDPNSILGKALAHFPPESLPSFVECIALAPLPIACALVMLPNWLVGRKEDEISVRSCNQFRKTLVLLVSTWCVFYFLVFLHQIGWLQAKSEPWIDFLNNLQGVFLFASYWILTAKTIPGKDREAASSLESPVPLWAVYLFLLWGVVVFLGADAYLSPAFTYAPNSDASRIRTIFQLLSGLWVGVTLALLAGCLEGQYLGQPRWVASSLYLYAALQVAYVGFFSQSSSNSSFLEQFSTLTSLPLKLIFIGFWCWVYEIGLLAFYMRKTREGIEGGPGEWEHYSQPVVAS